MGGYIAARLPGGKSREGAILVAASAKAEQPRSAPLVTALDTLKQRT